MKRLMLRYLVGLACIAGLAPVTAAWAMMIAPPPTPLRVATADLVVVGKVTGFADRLVSVKNNPNDKNAVEYQVAIVKVEKALVGGKGLKEIRVGFVPPPPPPPPPPQPKAGTGVIRPHIRIRRYPTFSLALNQEACLFLTRHPTADLYVGQAYYSLINKEGNPNFEKEVAEIERCAGLLKDPTAGLKSDKADERLLTAGLLIGRYRTPRPGQTRTEPIDAAQSKLILEALARADWKQTPVRPFQLTPQILFVRLGLTEKDGWKPPQDFRQMPEAAKKWLEDHADSYRIQRYIANTSSEEKKKD